jgi:hypothetical protein
MLLVGAAVVMLALSTARTAQQEKQEQPRRAFPQRRAFEQERAADVGADTASHVEFEPLAVEFERLSSLRLHPNGNLLACDEGTQEIKLIDPAGSRVASIKLGFGPEAINVAADGTIYCGGQGQLAKIDKNGQVLKTVTVPENTASTITDRRRMMARDPRISGIAVSGRDVFVAFGSGWSLGSKSKLFRFDLELENPKLLAEGLRGCCQRCDIVARDGVLYLAENSAHRIVLFDREGEVGGKWGARSRTELEGFGSCCNPMNLAFDAAGTIYTAESGIGRVKRYSTDGKFLGLVGYVGVERFTNAGPLAASCSNIAVAVTDDGKRVYVMDYKNNVIRVLQKKGTTGGS